MYQELIYAQNVNKNFTYSGSGEIEIPNNVLKIYEKHLGTVPMDRKGHSLTEDGYRKEIEVVIAEARTKTVPTALIYYAGDQKADQQNGSLGIADDVATPINYGRMGEFETSKESYYKAMFNIIFAEFAKGKVNSNNEKIAIAMEALLKDTLVDVYRFDGRTLWKMSDVIKNTFDNFRFTSTRKPFGMSLGEFHKVCVKGATREALNEYALHSAEVLVINEDAMFCYNEDCRKPFIYLEKEIKEQAPTKSHPRKQAKRPEAFYDTKYAICPHCGRVHTRREFDDSREYIENVLMPRAYENLEKGLKKPELGTKTEEGFKIRSQRKVAEIEINDAPIAPTEELTKAGPVHQVKFWIDRPGLTDEQNLRYKALRPTHTDAHTYVNHMYETGRSSGYVRPKVTETFAEIRAEGKASIERYEEALRKKKTPELFNMNQVLFNFEHKCSTEEGYKKSFWTRTHYMFIEK